jgi:hypothetical protein
LLIPFSVTLFRTLASHFPWSAKSSEHPPIRAATNEASFAPELQHGGLSTLGGPPHLLLPTP